jgi:hypothetical protein
LQKTVAALEEAASLAEARFRRLMTLAVGALALALAALGVALVVLFLR